VANIIVTGAGGALGRAVVEELARNEHRVAAVDLAALPPVPQVVGAFSGVDLTNEAAVEETYSAAAAALGSVNWLVNVAGGFEWEPIDGGSLDTWGRMQRINLRTAVISCRAVLRHMTAGRGAIVNVGAAGAVNPGLGMAPYAASKAGVMALTESLAEELKSRGIRVNAVLPTVMDTPTNRRDMPDADTSDWVHPSDAAKAIAFLLSDDAAAITGVGIKLSLGRPRA
jgi:NAD(P)-dependent dehydrogenase (short-subunit alcohol dehydrogenase family)